MEQTKGGWVYIEASAPYGTLYIGVTSDLPRRGFEHRNGAIKGFSKKYGCNKLVYYEWHDEIALAIHREKQLKKWNRAWKCRLVDGMNPKWADLYESLP